MSAASVRSLLERHGLQALKELGQNFLVDEGLAERLAERAGVEAPDTVIEIGTGFGTLTRALARRAERVVTLEVDAGLVRALSEESLLPANVELHHADALRCDLAALAARARGPVRLVANLPYSISGPMLRRFLDLRGELVDWSVMVQREVADRLLAHPGSRSYGSLGVLHRLVVEPSRSMNLEPGCFHPRPRVRSTFLRMIPRVPPVLAPGELARVERIVRAAFSQRRKTLANALRRARQPVAEGARIEAALERLGIDPRARAETLAPERFAELARALATQ